MGFATMADGLSAGAAGEGGNLAAYGAAGTDVTVRPDR
jgi:hypothetical protein